MDRVDADILRLLSWNPINPVDAHRGPYGLWDIARHREVHGNTVKRRLKEMEDAGLLLGLALFPNGVDIGVDVYGVKMRFDSFDACRAAQERILDMNRQSWHRTGARPLARAVSEGLAGLEEWVKAE